MNNEYVIRNHKQSGFSLVEISIVLVIIGLLLGSVLKGQEMIKGAKVKVQMQQINGIIAAVNTYIDRYGSIPGDLNKDGQLSDKEGDVDIWKDLSRGGFISGYSAATGGTFRNKYAKKVFARTNIKIISGIVICSVLPLKTAKQIDKKLDDDTGTDGSIKSISISGGEYTAIDYPKIVPAADNSINTNPDVTICTGVGQ